MKKTNKKGFTLIELLAVIAIIAIIGAIATPNVIKLITSSNQDQILSDAKLAISKAKYKFRKDINDPNKTNGVVYEISELIESDNSYDEQSKVQVSQADNSNKYTYSIYISNNKYCIGKPNEFESEENILDQGKGVVTNCEN